MIFLNGVPAGIEVSDAVVSDNTTQAVTNSTNTPGVSEEVSRSDHKHAHGNLTTATLHAVATAIANGFMPSTDKAKLDGMPADAQSAAEVATAIEASTADDETPVITVAKVRLQEHFGALAAPEAVTVHADDAGGAPVALATAFTALCPARTVRIKRDAAGAQTTYTITGTRFGAVQTEDVASDGANDVETTKAFDTVTAITSDVDPDCVTSFVTGAGFGLGAAFSDLDAVGVDGVVEAPTSSHGASGTIVPATEPDGIAVYSVRYRVLPTATQAAHGHTLTA